MANIPHLLFPRAFVPFTGLCGVGTFLQRVKRFSVEMEYEGLSTWVHSNNSGSMLGLLRRQSPMLASPANNPKRKLQWTQEAMWFGNPALCSLLGKEQCEQNTMDEARQCAEAFWVGVNTSIPNKMIEIAFHAGALSWAEGYTSLAREKSRQDKQSSDEKTNQTQGESKNKAEKAPISRFDAKLEGPNLPTLWVECKNVTMVEDDVACFPDAVTERGAKHLREMMHIVHEGERAAMFYLVQRPDGHCFGPADFVDPAYAALFYEAMDVGVEMYAYRGVVTREGVALGAPLSIKKPSC